MMLDQHTVSHASVDTTEWTLACVWASNQQKYKYIFSLKYANSDPFILVFGLFSNATPPPLDFSYKGPRGKSLG